METRLDFGHDPSLSFSPALRHKAIYYMSFIDGRHHDETWLLKGPVGANDLVWFVFGGCAQSDE